MVDWTGQNAARVVLGALLGRLIPFIGPWIAVMLTQLVSARLSRRDEFEADAFAAALMRKAGLDAGAQTSLLGKLEKMTPRGSGGFAWLMSHPPAKTRIAAIERLQAEWDRGGRPPAV